MKGETRQVIRRSSDPDSDFSIHALSRMARRNVTEADIAFVIRYGQKLHRDGVVFYFLRRRDLPQGMARAARRLEGTTVVMDATECMVITVYRNRKALRKIKRKPKTNYHSNYAEGEGWAPGEWRRLQ